jgi:hypothetical protein
MTPVTEATNSGNRRLTADDLGSQAQGVSFRCNMVAHALSLSVIDAERQARIDVRFFGLATVKP